MKRKSIIYVTVFLTFMTGIFIFMPAVAKQGQDNPSSSPHNTGGKEGLSEEEGEEIQNIMKALEDRERELAIREDAVKKEEERLHMLKNAIELSLRQYSAMRDRLQKGLSGSGGGKGAQQGIGHIAKIYEAMSPEEAARRIEKMDSAMAVELLSRIKSKQAGKIMGAISAEKAAALSEKIAGKREDK